MEMVIGSATESLEWFRLRLFRRKILFVVKYFQESHFIEKYFMIKTFFTVWRAHGKSQIFFIFTT
jgi:hypothetical protein